MAETFDIVVIGGGPGGYPAAIRAAQRGKKVALIEAKELGGSCLNRGCIPSKALIAGAEILETVQHAAGFGISVKGISFDYAQMVARKDKLVASIRKSLEGLITSQGIKIIKGKGELVKADEVKVNGEILKAKKIILAAGSEPREISAFPFDKEKILDSTDILEMKELPKSIAIVGGGVIGCEFASLYNLLGVEVTVIEMLPSLLPAECPSVSTALTRIFQKRGIALHTGVKVEGIEKGKGGVKINLSGGKVISAEKALVAVGRKMNLEGLGLEKVGIKLKNPQEILVNDKMETSVPNIYAVGDIASKWWLAHVATHQGIVAADNACGIPAKIHYEAIPNVIFTSPEIATVGICLEEAKKRGYTAAAGTFPFQALGKSQALLQTDGFAQIVIDEKTGEILGAQVVGNDASNLIAEMALAIQNELTIECVHNTIHAHPTLGESWLEAALLATNVPIHFPPKRKT